MGKNLQLLMKIYNNIGETYRFIFYKRFTYDTIASIYDTDEVFVNTSTLNSDEYNDNFTNNFNLETVSGEPTDLDHYFYTYISSKINTFHLSNRLLFRTNTYEDYFKTSSEKHLPLLWAIIKYQCKHS